MKSIKPGRGPSGMAFIGSIVAIIFGLFWTILAASLTAGHGLVGVFFPLFGVLFIFLGVAQMLYHYRNATGKDRYSILDITDRTEEGDPSDRWIKARKDSQQNISPRNKDTATFCAYCGEPLASDFLYCPKCGRAK